MSPDRIPHISLGTAVLLIFALCAGFVLLRGVTRVLIGTIVLGLSAWFAFIVWREAPALSEEWFGKSMPLVTSGLPLAAFVASFLAILRIAGAMARPFSGRHGETHRPPSLTGVLGRLLLACIPTALVCLVAVVFIHHNGSIAEIRALAGNTRGTDLPASAIWLQNLKLSLARVLPAAWLESLDPLARPERLALAKVITSRSSGPLAPVIDPATGKPIPRAIIVDDPALQKLAREGKYGTLLRHPLLGKALEDPKIRALLEDLSP